MLIHTLALSSLFFCLPPNILPAGQDSSTTKQETSKKSEEGKVSVAALEAEILGNEAETSIDRDFKRAMDTYKTILNRLASINSTRDVKADIERVLRQWAISVIVTRSEMGPLSWAQLSDLREGVPEDFVPNNPRFANLWHSVFDLAIQDERVTSLVQAPVSPGEPNAGIDPVRRAVNEFLSNNNHDAIVRLGRRALPALIEIVASDLDYLCADRKNDSLVTLARVDDSAAASFVLENMEKGGTLWRSRVLRLFVQESPRVAYCAPDAWSDSSKRGAKLLRSYWLEVLEKLTKFDDIRKDTVEVLDHGLILGVLTPTLQEFLADALSADDPGIRAAAMRNLRYGQPGMTLVRVMEKATASPLPETRAWAATILGILKPSSVLFSLADDPEEQVRLSVLDSLQTARLYDPETGTTTQRDMRDRPKTETDLLRRFLTDPAPQVRQSAAEIAAFLNQFDVPDQTILALLRDEDAGVRASAIHWVDQLNPGLRASELMRLVSATDEGILAAVDASLYGKSDAFTPGELLRLTEARAANVANDFWDSGWSNIDLLQNLAQSREGIEWVGVLAQTDEDICETLIRFGWVHQLTEDTYRKLIVSSFKRSGVFDSTIRLASRGEAFQYDDVWNSIAADEETPVIYALRSLSHAARSRPEESVAHFRGILDSVVSDVSMDWLAGYIYDVPAEARNPMIWMLLQHSGLLPRAKDKLAQEYDFSAPNADAIQEWILDAYAADDRTVEQNAVNRAITHMVSAPGSERRDVLIRAMKNPALCEAARDTIVALRDPSYINSLRDILLGPGPTAVHTGAIDALQSYMSDDAAEVLIEAAGFLGNAELRKHALWRLEGIREYQDAAARWAVRKTSKQNRDSVVAELIVMLNMSDPVIRAEAIRGLGTLEAVEHLPLLILLLKDPKQEIRDAARSALDRIHEGSKPQAK